MLNTNKSHVIVLIETKGKDIIYHGKTKNVNHVLINSESSLFTIIEIKYFDNVVSFDQTLHTVINDLTGDSILEDATFYNCDSFIKENNINIQENTIKLYDYNQEVYSLLKEWFHAEDRTDHKLNKDCKGFYIVTGTNIFNPNKLYLTEQDAKENHKRQYLQITLNEMQSDKNNWKLKEVITEKEFQARCNFLNKLNSINKKVALIWK